MSARIRCTMICFLLVLAVESASAQHLDVLVQVLDGKLVTGTANYDTNTWSLGQRVFKRQFMSNFRTNDPGFTTLETGNQTLNDQIGNGVLGLDSGINLEYDIIPTTIGGQQSNFWYWDGVDPLDDGFELADVSFELGAPGLEWRVLDDGGTTHIADGSDTSVPGVLVQETFSSGAVHSHIIMLIVDNDGDTEVNRPEGIYLTTMVMRAEGFEDSEPFMFVHRTAGLTNEPRDIAATWADENYDALIGAALPGDFDGNGDVDGADYLTWQRDLGTAGDLADWQGGYGAAAISAPAAAFAVPEPATLSLIALTSVACLATRRPARQNLAR
ncbi:MAG: PEP-CTERM sorting domain-containing protein [Planctomycetota bacterium]